MINLANVFFFTDKPGSPEEQWYYQHQMLRPTWCHYCTVSHHAFLSYIMSTPFIFFSSCFFHLFFDFLGTFTPGAADLMLLWLKRRARAKTKSVARIHVLRGWGCRGEGFPWKHTHTETAQVMCSCTENIFIRAKVQIALKSWILDVCEIFVKVNWIPYEINACHGIVQLTWALEVEP